MSAFEFMYNNTWYTYENGYIYNSESYNHEQRIPVVKELAQTMENLSLPDKQNIMCAIVHGYTYGTYDGAADKAREIRRVLCIEERCGI
jgi:hypothetical protein